MGTEYLFVCDKCQKHSMLFGKTFAGSDFGGNGCGDDAEYVLRFCYDHQHHMTDGGQRALRFTSEHDSAYSGDFGYERPPLGYPYELERRERR